jgi:hypothetical protein
MDTEIPSDEQPWVFHTSVSIALVMVLCFGSPRQGVRGGEALATIKPASFSVISKTESLSLTGLMSRRGSFDFSTRRTFWVVVKSRGNHRKRLDTK